MNPPRVQPEDYIDFLIATPKAASGTEAARVQPAKPDAAAHERGFKPRCVAFDGWYSSLDNLKLLRELGWTWLTRLKANRLVNKDRQGQRPLSRTEISASGTVVWLVGYGLVKVFKIVAPD